MRNYVLYPEGWSCSIEDCRPGAFLFNYNGIDFLWFKSEYKHNDGKKFMCFNEAGEYLNMDIFSHGEHVQPVVMHLEEIHV